MKGKTIYFTQELLEEIGNVRPFNTRVIELIKKGLMYEQKGDKLGIREAITFLYHYYNKKNPTSPIK